MTRRILTMLFSGILLCMVCVTGWASLLQPVWEWTGLTRAPDHAWTIATLFDAYFGFLTFYLWVLFKERRVRSRVLWFIAIMALGNMAMAVYVLKELRKLDVDDDMARLLIRRNG